MIAYESYQRGITNKVDLIAYSHGEEGKNEYSRNRKTYVGIAAYASGGSDMAC